MIYLLLELIPKLQESQEAVLSAVKQGNNNSEALLTIIALKHREYKF